MKTKQIIKQINNPHSIGKNEIAKLGDKYNSEFCGFYQKSQDKDKWGGFVKNEDEEDKELYYEEEADVAPGTPLPPSIPV